MSIWSTLFRRASKIPVGQAIAVIERILELADGDRIRYRELLAQAAARGDLDEPLEQFQAANARSKKYIRGKG